MSKLSPTEYAAHDATALATLVAKGEVTPGELVEAAIALIERHNAKLGAVVHKAFDEARQTAAGALADGPFKGVPFLVKDIGRPVRGWPVTMASRFAVPGVAERDAIIIQRYRQAGLVLLGATNTSEFGLAGVTQSLRFGPCRNPWNADRISGGSSGGAAAAVASGMVPLAHATDALGSIRIPSACCGLVGLKPTRMRNPIEPAARAQILGISVDHVVCRTVRDSAAMLDATGLPQAHSPYASPPKGGQYVAELGRAPGRLRIGWASETPSGRPIDAEVQAALEGTAAALAELGHDVRHAPLAFAWDALYAAHNKASAAYFATETRELVRRIGREPGDDDLEPVARRLYEKGCAISGLDALTALQDMRIMSWDLLERLEAYDVYLTPVLGVVPPRVEDIDPRSNDLKTYHRRSADTFPFTGHVNMTGQPAISLPLCSSRDGLPIGMQFIGRFGDEATLIRLAAQLERELPWRDRRPAIWG